MAPMLFLNVIYVKYLVKPNTINIKIPRGKNQLSFYRSLLLEIPDLPLIFVLVNESDLRSASKDCQINITNNNNKFKLKISKQKFNMHCLRCHYLAPMLGAGVTYWVINYVIYNTVWPVIEADCY